MILYLVLPLTIVLHIAYSGTRVSLSLFALSLGASPFAVGVLLSLLALVPMTFSIAVGRAIDHIGVRRPMLIGAAALFAGIAMIAISPRLQTLYIASGIIGSGFILFHISVTYVAGVVGEPHQRVKNFTWLALCFSTSTIPLSGTCPKAVEVEDGR